MLVVVNMQVDMCLAAFLGVLLMGQSTLKSPHKIPIDLECPKVPQVYDIRAQAMLVQCQRNGYFCKAMLVQSSAMFTQCWSNSNKKMSPAVYLETNLCQNSPDFKKNPIYHLSFYVPPLHQY